MGGCELRHRRQTLRWLIAGLGAAAGAGWLVNGLGSGLWLGLRRGALSPGAAADLAGTPGEDICIASPPLPASAFGALANLSPRPVPTAARCPVCGMYAARFPRWAAQAIYRDGATHFFDAPLCLMLHRLDVARRAPGRSAADLAALYVTPFDKGVIERSWMRAEMAWYVLDSTARGPMGEGNLPAFSGAVDAIRFAARHGGQPLAFDRIAPQVLRALDRRRHDHGSPPRVPSRPAG